MWWNEMRDLQRVCFIIGCCALAFMLVQIILMLIGFGEDDAFSGDVDADMDIDVINDEGITHLGLNIISLRSIIAFLCMGSFATFFFMYYLPWWGALLLGLLIGCIAGFLMALAINGLNKLQTSGNLDIRNCVGKIGDVYLTVPAKRGGQGKVNIFVQERLAEFEAVTDFAEPIKTGAQVKVVGVVNEGLLSVMPYSTAQNTGTHDSSAQDSPTEPIVYNDALVYFSDPRARAMTERVVKKRAMPRIIKKP